MSQLSRFLIAGVGTVGLYIGGVWWGTEIAGFPPRAVNWVFYILATGISFLLAYLWIFKSKAPPLARCWAISCCRSAELYSIRFGWRPDCASQASILG
ncbi:GtrA family protein [Litorimonas sp. RW-G-Af-16]